jgi:hypothetical protein
MSWVSQRLWPCLWKLGLGKLGRWGFHWIPMNISPKTIRFFEKNVANDIPPFLDDLPMKKHHLYSFTLW